MSALASLTAKPFAPATGPSKLTVLTSSPPPTPSASGSSLGSLTAKPFVPPPLTPATTPTYFQGKEPTGTFIGISDQNDPFSGRPFLAYRSAGDNATTTDKTRTAPLINPEVPTKTAKPNFENPRMPQSASEAIRKDQGATGAEQLDHRMALAVGGSNAPENLKLIPTAENQAASSNEGKYAQAVADGTMSLFEAQTSEARDKGLAPPFVDQAKKAAILSNMVKVPDNSFLGVLRNTILGLPKAATDVGLGIDHGIGGLADSIVKQYTEPSPLEQSMEGQISPTLGPIKAVDAAVLRTIEPMVEPLVTDVTAGIIFNNPDLYAHFVNNIVEHGPSAFTEPVTAATQKSPSQVVGDAAQAVIGAYMPDLLGEGLAGFASKGFGEALTTAALHAAPAGAAFGTAQALSSGTKDPKEFAAIVLKNVAAAVLLNLATAGVVHGLSKSVPVAVDAIKAQLPKNLAEAQRGFVKNPFAEGEPKPEEGKPAENAGEEATPEGAIPPKLEPLAEMARKFKSPEEFVAATKTPKVEDYGVKPEDVTGTLLKDVSPSDVGAIDKTLEDFHSKANTPVKIDVPAYTRAIERMGRPTGTGDALTELAASNKSPHDFYLALAPHEQQMVRERMDPEGLGKTTEEAAHAFYAAAHENVLPRDTELPPPAPRQQLKEKSNAETIPVATPARRLSDLLKEGAQGKQPEAAPIKPLSVTEEHNGGVTPPENKGGMKPPEIDWTTGKDIAAPRQSTDTLERTLEKIFPKKEADILNNFLTEANRRNEADKVEFVTKLRKDTQTYVVKELGIKPATIKSAWVQRLGEGRVSVDELKKALPKDWQNVVKASDFFRKQYDDLINKWNVARSLAGLKPINKRPNYFRHFIDLSSFAHMYGFDFRESGLPTAISGITEYFRSQSPWTNAAMRRLGNTTTDDAVGGFDNYLDTVARAIYHTDTVQRGRLVDKYMRKSAEANGLKAQDIRDSDEDKDIPPPIELPKLAHTLKQWTDVVSGKQVQLDRSIETYVGRPTIAFMRAITRQFGLNVIGGNLSAAVTHAIPSVYTLATVDKGAAFHGLYGTLTSPFLEDFRKIDGVRSDFLTRRFGKDEIDRTLGEKVGAGISAPFHLIDQFISRWAVESKYHEQVKAGKSPQEAMQAADNYASRVIGDRSAGNLPPIMSTKTLGWFTQFQIEVNDNLRVLLHDIPRWEAQSEHYLPGKAGVYTGIANRFVQFAVFSYLFNQTMQYVKGSGKGLDPIDLGLTLMGLNDEGHDKTLMQRLSAVGTDFAKELPFTSVPTGGQIPALQPLGQAIADAQAGSYLKGLEGLLYSFASPVGGGQQLQKSLTAIQAWQQGYVTDSKGAITATVPHDLPTLAQGVAFGKSAFDSVKKSKTELGNLSETIKEQQATAALKNQQADNIWQQLKGMSPDAAKAQLLQIAKADPDMAKRVLQSAKDDAEGITKQDTMLKALGVANGERAQYIVGKLNAMSTAADKKAYLLDLAKKNILTAAVLKQVVRLLGGQ